VKAVVAVKPFAYIMPHLPAKVKYWNLKGHRGERFFHFLHFLYLKTAPNRGLIEKTVAGSYLDVPHSY